MKIKMRRILTLAFAGYIQVSLLILLLTVLEPIIIPIDIALVVFSLFAVLYVMSKREEPSYSMLWLVVILLIPLAGYVLFVLFGEKRSGKPVVRRMQRAAALMCRNERSIAPSEYTALRTSHERLMSSVDKIEKESGYYLHSVEHAEYFDIGESLYARMLEELSRARKFIYCEYFIISHGVMWDRIEDIMAEKAAQGVDVRVLYDDIGSLGTFAPDEIKRLAARNIKCVRFNPVYRLNGTLNYRDHRKMLIIDGNSAFSGGINLADEYINHIERFGHWKDIGFYITGPAVMNYTHMFIKFWNAYSEDRLSGEIENVPPSGEKNGYVLSYYDSPLKKENLSNDLYIDFLYQARKYVWFYAPYLIPGSHLTEAFESAARRGVDVRIITPGIPDKKIVFRMTRSYYRSLLEAGVRIYEYTPGFVHAKGCVMDDEVAAVGTVNLDYRSLYMHYENNSVFIESDVVGDVKTDMLATMNKSTEQIYENYAHQNVFLRIADAFLRVFSPLC